MGDFDIIDALLPQCLKYDMSFETFYTLTVAEIMYWLQCKDEVFIDGMKWDAKLAHYTVTKTSYAYHQPSKLNEIEKDFPTLFNETLDEEAQEARFIAQAKEINRRKGFDT